MAKKAKPEKKKAVIPDTLIQHLLETYAGGAQCFKPNRIFYEKVGIKSRRWWKLVRCEASPTLEELRKICAHFNIAFAPETIFRQLTLFPDLEIKTPVKIEK